MNRFRRLFPLIVMVLFVACTGKNGQLKPFDENEDSNLILVDQPRLVTFSELQTDPEAYRDKLIRVTGTYMQLQSPNCYPYSGPGAQWALISEGLRLDIIGFERLTRLIGQDTIMTIDGFFRLYEGPIGCGKRAPIETAWFLEMLQVVQPNPLALAGRLPGGDGGSGFPLLQSTPTGTLSPEATQPPIGGTGQPTNVPTATPVGTFPVLPTSTGTVTPIGTSPSTSIPTGTSTPLSTPIATQTATRTPTRTPTLAPGVPTSTATSGPASTSPPLPTATEGYPGFPPATATSDGYPSSNSGAQSPSYP